MIGLLVSSTAFTFSELPTLAAASEKFRMTTLYYSINGRLKK